MNVGEMKKLLANVDDNVQIFAEFGDHEMMLVTAGAWYVAQNTDTGDHFEYFSVEGMEHNEIAIPAIIIE